MTGRLEAWRERQEERARERQARLRDLDAQLREAVERRELPRPRTLDLPADGTLPPDVAVLVDDGQVRRGAQLLANLCGIELEEAEAAVAAHLHRQG